MRWLLAGCCGLALFNILVAKKDDVKIKQQPFFYGTITGHSVLIECRSSENNMMVTAEWFKAPKYNSKETERKEIQLKERMKKYATNKTKSTHSYFHIDKLLIEDSGVYFCKIGNKWGPGTEVQVARPINRSKAQHRTNMKDGLIVIQGLLLAACIAALVLRKRNLFEKRDSIYEEPETDHIYEGLAIETCGGGLYEELSVYAQAEGAEAPWE